MVESTIAQIRARLSARTAAEDGGGTERRDRRILALIACAGLAVLTFTLVRGGGGSQEAAVTVAAAAEEPGGRPATAGAPTEPADPVPAEATGRIRVHVAGAVARPGVFTLPAGTIAEEAVAAAGGPLPDAELSRVNLAGKLADGQQFFVPRAGEPVPVQASAPSSGAAPTSPVDINSADVAALDSLPGIGAATAQKIVAYRDEHGPFRDVRGLLDVPGIGEGKLAAIADLVTT